MPVNLKPDNASISRSIPQKGITSFLWKTVPKNINKTNDYSQGEKYLSGTPSVMSAYRIILMHRKNDPRQVYDSSTTRRAERE